MRRDSMCNTGLGFGRHLLIAAVALLAGVSASRASVISGGISFNGNVTPYLNTAGTGSPATDLVSAKSLVFGASVVSAGANGSFASIPTNTTVSMYSPLLINAPALPSPATDPLWSVTVGPTTWTFTLATLTEPVDTTTYMVLTGTGTFGDGTSADSSTGTWVATFTTSGSTYSWNSSASANTTPAIPEPACLGLLSIGCLALLHRRA